VGVGRTSCPHAALYSVCLSVCVTVSITFMYCVETSKQSHLQNCSLLGSHTILFLSRVSILTRDVSILTRDIDIANLSVCLSVRLSVRPLHSGIR